jgi:hypothetical protein
VASQNTVLIVVQPFLGTATMKQPLSVSTTEWFTDMRTQRSGSRDIARA